MISSPGLAKRTVLAGQRLGADDDIDAPIGEPGADGTRLSGRREPGEGGDADAKPGKSSPERLQMLSHQDGRGRYQDDLQPLSAAIAAARKATSVLPYPTSPQTSRSIGRPAAKSASTAVIASAWSESACEETAPRPGCTLCPRAVRTGASVISRLRARATKRCAVRSRRLRPRRGAWARIALEAVQAHPVGFAPYRHKRSISSAGTSSFASPAYSRRRQSVAVSSVAMVRSRAGRPCRDRDGSRHRQAPAPSRRPPERRCRSSGRSDCPERRPA